MNFGNRDFYVWVVCIATIYALVGMWVLYIYQQLSDDGRALIVSWMEGFIAKLAIISGIVLLIVAASSTASKQGIIRVRIDRWKEKRNDK